MSSITAVPSWAEFDYSSLTGQTWDPVRAQLISQQAAGNGTNTGTDNSGNGGGKKSSIAGPVAGGVVGGVAVILAVIGAFWWRRRRLAKRRQSDMQDLSSEKNASDNGKVPAPTPSTIAYQQSYFPASEPPSPPVHSVHNEDMRYYLSSTPQSSSDGGRVVTSLYPSQVLHRSAVPELQSSPEVDEPDTYDSFRRSG
ncbi:hypothetical protein BT69DRAFT_1350382 [Atractiella rhizophila]|nr:hypothetical protein BT69DRAFT_1350382 [Atractiella rhizophila]